MLIDNSGLLIGLRLTLSQANPLSGQPSLRQPSLRQPSLRQPSLRPTLPLVNPLSGQTFLWSTHPQVIPLSGQPSLRPSLSQTTLSQATLSQATLSHSGQQRPTLPLVNPFSGRSTHSNSRSSWNGSHRSCFFSPSDKLDMLMMLF